MPIKTLPHSNEPPDRAERLEYQRPLLERHGTLQTLTGSPILIDPRGLISDPRPGGVT